MSSATRFLMPAGACVAVLAACSGDDSGSRPSADGGAAQDGSMERSDAGDARAPANPDGGEAPDSSTDARAPRDGSTDAPSAVDAPSFDAPPLADGGPGLDVCTVGQGTLAWTASIAGGGAALAQVDVAAGPTNDVVVADILGASLEQRRWNQSGTFVSTHEDPAGTYAGTIFPSRIIVDAQNDVFYGYLLTGQVQGSSLGAELAYSRIDRTGASVFLETSTATEPSSSGAPSVSLFVTGFDTSGNLHSPFVMGTPQYFVPGVYCWGPTGANLTAAAANVVTSLGPYDDVWTSSDSGLYLSKALTASTDLGCTTLTVPAGGGVALAKFSGGGSCSWNHLLALPTAAVKQRAFKVGADGSLLFAVVYSGTIDFGGGMLTSTGTTSLGLARYDASGTLLYAKTFGGPGSSFTLGSLAGNASGDVAVTGGFAGTVSLGPSALPSSGDTFLASFDSTLTLRWSKVVTVGGLGTLQANAGPCGFVMTTNSPTVDLGTGALSTGGSIGVAALGM